MTTESLGACHLTDVPKLSVMEKYCPWRLVSTIQVSGKLNVIYAADNGTVMLKIGELHAPLVGRRVWFEAWNSFKKRAELASANDAREIPTDKDIRRYGPGPHEASDSGNMNAKA